jgi:hypothetical protein
MASTVADFVSQLRNQDRQKPVCFCGSPEGLQFYRVKRRGPELLQLEFNESVYRQHDGQLWIDAIDAAPADPAGTAPTVGGLLDWLDRPETQKFELIFGGDHEALEFAQVSALGEWANVEFLQRVYRAENGGFVVEESRNGQAVRKEFPLRTTRDPRVVTTGAFGAINVLKREK